METCHCVLRKIDEESKDGSSSNKKNSKERMVSESTSNNMKERSGSKTTSGSKDLCGDTTEKNFFQGKQKATTSRLSCYRKHEINALK